MSLPTEHHGHPRETAEGRAGEARVRSAVTEFLVILKVRLEGVNLPTIQLIHLTRSTA